ncbi:MAG TPA: hypothetical protein VI357_14750 [Mycobacteriales bacterium]
MTAPGYERLRAAMADLAAGAAPTDLHDRALRTSRRSRRRRTTAAVAAGLVIVSGGTATAAGLLSAPGGKTAADGGSYACPAAVPTDPSPAPSHRPAETGPAPRTGPLFYLAASGSSAELVSWTPGQSTPVPRRRLPMDALSNANVSPDGTWVSWVTSPDGVLHLAALDGGRTDRVLRTGVDGRLLEPVWSRDSTRLLVREMSSDRVGTVDVASGTFTTLPTDLDGARDAVWAADGSAIALITADGGVMVAEPDGSGLRRIPAVADFIEEGRKVASLQSMSGKAAGDAALNLFVTAPGQDPDGCRSLVSNTTIRTGDGRQGQDEAQRGGRYRAYQAAFRGRYFSHVDRELGRPRTIELIGDNGEFLGGTDEPPQLSRYLLLNN